MGAAQRDGQGGRGDGEERKRGIRGKMREEGEALKRKRGKRREGAGEYGELELV